MRGHPLFLRLKTAAVRLLVLLLLLTAGCADLGDDTQLADRKVRDAMPSEEFSDAVITHTVDGDTSFVLHAPGINRYDRTDVAKLFGGIEVQFFRESKRTSTLTADSGQVLRGGRELRASGNVVVVTDSGLVILTPRLKWTEKDKRIRSDTSVTLISEQDTLYGTGLIATDDLKNRRILNPSGVTRRKAPPSDEGSTTDGSEAIPEENSTVDSLSAGGE